MDKFYNVLYVLGLSIFIMSCGTSKRVYKGNRLYRVKQVFVPPPAGGFANVAESLEIYELSTRIDTKFTDKTDYLLFNTLPAGETPVNTVPITATDLAEYSQFLPTTKPSSVGIPTFGKPFYNMSSLDLNPKKAFRYGDGKFVLQAVSITLKIRPQPKRDVSYYPTVYTATQIQAAIDSIPTQAEAGINLGFAFGYKFNFNLFRVTKDAFGRNTTQFSITPAVMLGTGITDITSANTRVPKLITRKEPFFSYGGMIMIGYNNINIGYATGWDRAIGEYGDKWVYGGKRWHGIVIALDVLK